MKRLFYLLIGLCLCFASPVRGQLLPDDEDFTAGSTPGTPVMGSYQFTVTNITDGDLGILGITTERWLKVSIQGTAAGDLAKTEDSVHVSGDAGIAVWGVRQSTQADFAADGEVSTTNSDSETNATQAVTVDEIETLDVSASLTGLAAGDYVGMNFQSDTSNIRAIGLWIKY